MWIKQIRRNHNESLFNSKNGNNRFGSFGKSSFYHGVEIGIQYNMPVLLRAKKHGYKVYDKGNGSLKIMDPKTTGKAEVTCLPDGKFEIKTSGFKGKSCMKFETIEKALGRIDSTKKTAEYYDNNTAKARLTEWS